MKPRALITHMLLPEAMDFLAPRVDYDLCPEKDALAKDDILSRIADKEGLLCLLTDEIDRDIMDAAPRLKIIANCAVGFNNIDVACAREKGILVTNTPGVLTETTADLTWALILAVARKIPQADRFTRAGFFTGWKLDLFLGREITGKRLGIVGLGRIGKAVTERARGFRLDVVYFDSRRLSRSEEQSSSISFLPLDDLLQTSDIVSVHASMTPETHHLLSRDKIRLMKKEAIFINVARGPIVDEKALAEALAEGRLFGAGIDVYEREPEIEPELLRLDNVVLLPHIGSATYETRLKMAMAAARNLIQGLRGEKPDNLIV
jgi:glyoxylate reductase